MKQIIKIIIELFAALLALVVIAVMLVAWRLTVLPINATSFTPYLERAITTLVPNSQVTVKSTSMAWNNQSGALTFVVDDVRLRSLKGDTVAFIPSANVEVAVSNLLRGRFIPSIIAVTKPQFWMTRDPQGLLTFGLHDDPDAEKLKDQVKEEAVDTTQIAATFAGLARELTHKKLSHAITMTDAVLLIHDDVSDKNWSVGVPSFSVHHEGHALAGDAKISIMQKEGESHLTTHFLYDRNARSHRVNLSFAQINPSFLAGHHPLLQPLQALNAVLDGEVDLRFLEDFTLATAHASIRSGKGEMTVPVLWEKVRPFEKAALQVDYDRAQKKLKIFDTQIDFGGTILRLDGNGNALTPQDAQKYDMAFSLKLALSNLPMSSFGDLWPVSIIPNVRLWIMANMTKGHFPGGDVTLKGKLAWNDLENTVLESGSGQIAAQNTRVTYMDDMPAVEGVNALARFDLDHMDVDILSGNVGSVRIQPFTLSLLDFQKPIQRIEIPLKLKGPVLDVLRIMDAPPLGYAKALGIRPDDCKGNIDGVLKLKFPLLLTLALNDVNIEATAKLFTFSAQGLIPSIEISNGDMDLGVTKDGFSLKGTAALNTVPFQVNWQGNFDAEARKLPRYAATITGTVAQHQWKLLHLDILDGRIQGDAQANVKFLQSTSALSQLSGDVNIKSASLTIKELNWEKKSGIPAQVLFAVDIPKGQNVTIKTLDLQTAGVKARGKIILDESTLQPLSIEMKPLVLGRTNANLSYTQTLGDKRMEHYGIDGESLDISGLSNQAPEPAPSTEPSKEYVLKLTRLYTGEENLLHKVNGVCVRDSAGWSKLSLHAYTDESAKPESKFDINLGNYDGRNALSIIAEDFGAALKSMAYTDTVRGGRLEIKGYGTPMDARKIIGKVNVTGFGVRDLPLLARLLSAASPFGFADFITGETSFDYLKGDFIWKSDVIELNKVRLLGSTYGINVNGKVEQKTGQANLQGTLVPFSFLNSIINAIPMLGNVITGGDGQGVLAVSYTVKGNLSEPDISVNPASLLTPGILRNLFFGD